MEFTDVTFSYQENRPILQGASFYVEPGEKVAIIGQNGSGKSTVLNLLLRFYTPDSGEIAADGMPVSQLSLNEYRALFSVVSQEPYLFLGNIALTGQAAQALLCKPAVWLIMRSVCRRGSTPKSAATEQALRR